MQHQQPKHFSASSSSEFDLKGLDDAGFAAADANFLRSPGSYLDLSVTAACWPWCLLDPRGTTEFI
jgi:hypothetical protein